jgi:hypothetical protein
MSIQLGVCNILCNSLQFFFAKYTTVSLQNFISNMEINLVGGMGSCLLAFYHFATAQGSSQKNVLVGAVKGACAFLRESK